MAESPVIYTGRWEPQRADWGMRVLAALVGVGALGVLVMAAKLEPDGSGMGTHRQLGLKQCAMLAQMDIPCPSCGMTTSFAWLVRGRLDRSLNAQPMGMMLGMATMMAVWGGIYIAITGRPAYRLLWRLPVGYYLIPLMALGVAAWGWKIWVYVGE